MWSRWAVQVTKGRVVNATTSLPLRWHCLWLNHLNHFNEHPFVLRHIVGAIRTCLLNLSSTSQKIKVSMLLLISFDGWKVGMVLWSLTADIILFIWIFVSNSNGNDMVWWCKVLHRYDDTILWLMTFFTILNAAYLRYRDTAIKRSNHCKL